MKKGIALLFLLCVFSGYCFSQTANTTAITVEITNIAVGGGKVYLAIFANADEFKNEKPYVAYELGDNNANISHRLSLPHGEYVISAFQDTNGNGKLDYGLFGIPKELVGISSYFGEGFPSKSFDKQKTLINNTTEKITIGLYKF